MTDGKIGHEHEAAPGTLSAQEIELRRRWLEFDERDEEILKEEVDKLIQPRVDELIEDMYDHFLAFEETRDFFPDTETLRRAKTRQGQYYRNLLKGEYGQKYVQERLQVGYTHYRIDLEPKWYIGAYNRALAWMLERLFEKFDPDRSKLLRALKALLKIIFFDMILAIESYISAKETAIRRHRDALRELETERRVTKSILESAPIGIVSLDRELVCVECNDEFIQILDLTLRHEVIGKSLFTLAPHFNRSLFQEVLSTGQPCRRAADRLNLSRSQIAEEIYWDWAAWPIKDDAGAVTGVVAMFSNATDRVMLQQQREDFVATLTHDLKTPVLATNRAVQFLLEGDFGPLADGQKEVLQTILQSNSALYGLVQTLLDVYRFDSGVKELHVKSCNLAAMIAQLVTEIMPLAQEKGLQLAAAVPADAREVSCDEDEMRRVLQNLMDNALKFTAPGGSIKVTMRQEGERTQISVSDTGRGIREEDKPKLFQRFWQAGTTGRYYASTGLGLYLSRRIIEGHGGRIWCESTAGKGSTFYIEI